MPWGDVGGSACPAEQRLPHRRWSVPCTVQPMEQSSDWEGGEGGKKALQRRTEAQMQAPWEVLCWMQWLELKALGLLSWRHELRLDSTCSLRCVQGSTQE